MKDWTLGPFVRENGGAPILGPRDAPLWTCPVRGEPVAWEAKDVFNPAAIVRDGLVHLIYRAEDRVGRFAGTSRLGLAVSEDGISFSREPAPVLYPDRDAHQAQEWEGGCEDPRVVELPDKTYLLTYTAYDGRVARLMVATSPDLRSWTKHGLAFRGHELGGRWTKSGAIVVRPHEGRFVAATIRGEYWMVFGESDLYVASSPDGLVWTPHARDEMHDRWIEHPDDGRWIHHETRSDARIAPVLSRRLHGFDSVLVEPGPPPILTDEGIVVLYNAKAAADARHPIVPNGYHGGQALLDPDDPTHVIGRTRAPFFFPSLRHETEGQVPAVTFLEGLARHRGRLLLYYGTADSAIGVASAPDPFSP